MKLQGTFTALVTPFTDNGDIDYPALEGLLEAQIEAGIEGILILGTTGESPTMSHEEYSAIIKFSVEKVDGRSLVIAGSGSNCTQKTIEHSQAAKEAGVDALLVVNPYYNKPTQEGLYQHFWAVAEAVDIPQILYNIQGRTGVNVSTETLVRLAKHKNIVAVKEASGDIGQMADVIAATNDFFVLSGDDGLTYPLICLGGDGVISVLSNILPAETKAMTDAALNGDYKKAKELHYKLTPLMSGCFMETNPIPVKTALAMKGKVKENFRLPMCQMNPDNRAKWEKILKENNYL